MKKVVFVGSSTLSVDAALGSEIVDLLREQGEDIAVLTRGSEGVDQFVSHACIVLGLRCFQYKAGGGADNFIRDSEMVRDGDLVIALLDPDTLKDSNTGTAHVLEVALRTEKPCRAYTVVEGTLVYAGEEP